MLFITFKLRFSIFGCLVVLILASVLMGAQGGHIEGRVTDNAGTALPGVTVQVYATSPPDHVLSALSDDQGRFRFIELPPGQYIVSAELAGFEKVSARQVVVTAGAVTELTIQLPPKISPEEKVTVTAQESPLSTTEAATVETVGESLLQNAPLASERFQDVLPLLPGVVRGPDGLLNVKGARASQSGYLVNSANVTDPVTGDFALSLPIEAVESVKVLSSPYSAEYGRFTGAVTSIETKPGGDRWKFIVQNVIPRLRRRNGSIMGIEAVTPRINFSGPILKNKLAISQSFEYRFIRTRVPSLPDLHNDTGLESFDAFTQLDYKINETNQLTTVLSLFPQNLSFVNLNTFNPQEVTPNFRQRGFFLAFGERAAFENGSLLESTFSVKQFNAHVFPNGDRPMVVAPQVNSGNYFNRQDRDSLRYEWVETYNFPPVVRAGRHAFKAGLNLSFNTYQGFNLNHTVLVARADGTLSQQIDFVNTAGHGPRRIERGKAEYSGFLQDQWEVTPQLHLELGLRYDRDTIAAENNMAPRFGFILLPFKDRRTVVRGGIGLFYDKIPLNVGAFEQTQSRVVTTFARDGVTVIDGPRLFQNVMADRLRMPYSTAWSAELDRELAKNLFFRFAYQQRESRGEFILDPRPGPGTTATLSLSQHGRSRYRELQWTLRYTLQEDGQLFFSYVRSLAVGDLNDFNTYAGNFPKPVIRPNERSRQPFDAPNRFLFWGDMRLPKEIILSPVLEVRDGFPFSIVDEEQNFIGRRNQAGRFPMMASFDLQVLKGFSISFKGKKYKAKAGLKVFNISGHFNPRDIQNNIASPQFDQFFNSVGRVFRGKFYIEF